MLNLRQINAFRHVMMYKTVTRAAEMMFVSQPAVSRLISDLEDQVGFQLFVRGRGRLVPTPEAQAFFEEVERSYVGLENMAEAAKEIRQFRTGKLLISAMPAMALSVLPPVLRRFLEKHPGISISLQVHSSQRISRWVATQQCDIGLTGIALDEPGTESSVLASADMMLVMPPDHPFAARPQVAIEELAGQQLISVGQLGGARPGIDRYLREHGIDCQTRIETQLSSAACELVLCGAGITLIDPASARFYQHRGLVIRPLSPGFPYTYHLLLPSLRPTSRLALELIDDLRQTLTELIEQSPTQALPKP